MSKTAFRAYGFRVLVNVQEMTTTKGGLHLPEDARVSNFATGVIVSCGHGGMLLSGKWDAPTVKVGDRILFAKASAVRVPEAGEFIFCLQMSEIIAVESNEELKAPT